MNAKDKLNMYKAVETVCATNHTEWNSLPRFGSAFSRFAVKVAQLDLLSGEVVTDPFVETSGNPLFAGERIRKLISEIDQLLQNSIDSFVKYLRGEHADFYFSYVSARTRW